MSKAIKFGLLLFLASSLFYFFGYLEDQDPYLRDTIIFNEINEERIKENLDPLVFDEQLFLVARKKLEDMFLNQYFEHTSLDGKDVNHLAEEISYQFIIIGENLVQGVFKDEKDVVRAWMESRGHRENILNSRYVETGVASRYGDFQGVNLFMAVQIFAVPLDSCPQADEGLLKRIEEKENIIDELTLKMQEEDNITNYNLLVEEHNETVSNISLLIEEYNEQVQKQKDCFSEYH